MAILRSFGVSITLKYLILWGSEKLICLKIIRKLRKTLENGRNHFLLHFKNKFFNEVQKIGTIPLKIAKIFRKKSMNFLALLVPKNFCFSGGGAVKILRGVSGALRDNRERTSVSALSSPRKRGNVGYPVPILEQKAPNVGAQV